MAPVSKYDPSNLYREIALQLTSIVKVCKISAEWTKLANIPARGVKGNRELRIGNQGLMWT